MKTIALTKSQSQALKKLKAFTKSKHKHFRLTGYAGTGKSFLIARFLKWLQNQDLKFTAASPTNKAAKNLEAIGTDNGLNLEVTTIAKLLGQQPELNEATGKEEFITTESTIAEYDIVILDEFSMISKKNFDDIVCEIYNKNTKIIYVGDSAQLPPVGEKFPVIATHVCITQSANLTEVVRYDGDIARVAETIKKNRQSGLIDDGAVEIRLHLEKLRKARRINNERTKKSGAIYVADRRDNWETLNKDYLLSNDWITHQDIETINDTLLTDYAYPPTYRREWIDLEHSRLLTTTN